MSDQDARTGLLAIILWHNHWRPPQSTCTYAETHHWWRGMPIQPRVASSRPCIPIAASQTTGGDGPHARSNGVWPV